MAYNLGTDIFTRMLHARTQQKEAEKQQQQQYFQNMMAMQQHQSQMFTQDFQRQLQVAQVQGEQAARLGKEMPHRSDYGSGAVGEMAELGYGGGTVGMQGEAEARKAALQKLRLQNEGRFGVAQLNADAADARMNSEQRAKWDRMKAGQQFKVDHPGLGRSSNPREQVNEVEQTIYKLHSAATSGNNRLFNPDEAMVLSRLLQVFGQLKQENGGNPDTAAHLLQTHPKLVPLWQEYQNLFNKGMKGGVVQNPQQATSGDVPIIKASDIQALQRANRAGIHYRVLNDDNTIDDYGGD